MSATSSSVPDDPTRAAVLQLAARVEAEDGAPPLSDQAIAQLGSPEVEHHVTRDGGELVGYAQRSGDGAEVVAERAAVGDVVDAVARPGLLIWSHGRRSRLAPVFGERGFGPIRELHQLRRPLTDLPAEPRLAAGVVVRPFVPGRDEDAWLAVNAAAFASHPEQSRWTRADLAARMAEPWFDPAGFLLAERAGELLGYHWTKVHPDGWGEVYVLGVAPAAQGLGLGNALLVRGLVHLAAIGCPGVLLYVDGDNPTALRLYEKSGFVSHDLDVQWQVPAAQ
ncbi:MAG TPA: mycothiol synthase [Jatrophihabitans sp.]|nr:mycothiol synthase [Jatrophihabitans sp.]